MAAQASHDNGICPMAELKDKSSRGGCNDVRRVGSFQDARIITRSYSVEASDVANQKAGRKVMQGAVSAFSYHWQSKVSKKYVSGKEERMSKPKKRRKSGLRACTTMDWTCSRSAGAKIFEGERSKSQEQRLVTVPSRTGVSGLCARAIGATVALPPAKLGARLVKASR